MCATNIMPSVEDLAGQLTDRALDLLHARGAGPISVDDELATWRNLKRILNVRRVAGSHSVRDILWEGTAATRVHAGAAL